MDFVRPVQALVPGSQGRILAVLAETSAELNLRTIARLSGVSVAQASRLLPALVELGVAERREAPPSALFRFVPENVAARAICALTDSRETVLAETRTAAAKLAPSPVSIIVFGSFARGEAVSESDIDLLVIRQNDVDEDDRDWRRTMSEWTRHVRRVSGNQVEVLEVAEYEASRLLRSRKPLWAELRRNGLVVCGASPDELVRRRSA